jgi:hypothetical protein
MPAFKRTINNKGKPRLPKANYLTFLLVLPFAPGPVLEPVQFSFLFMFWFFVPLPVRFCTVLVPVLVLDLAPALSAVWGKGEGYCFGNVWPFGNVGLPFYIWEMEISL